MNSVRPCAGGLSARGLCALALLSSSAEASPAPPPSPEDLDDAAQDVFIVFLRRRQEFRGQSSQRTWLFGIANNITHEYRRKRQRAARGAPIDGRSASAVSEPARSGVEQ